MIVSTVLTDGGRADRTIFVTGYRFFREFVEVPYSRVDLSLLSDGSVATPVELVAVEV